jgi:hypothetical protein
MAQTKVCVKCGQEKGRCRDFDQWDKACRVCRLEHPRPKGWPRAKAKGGSRAVIADQSTVDTKRSSRRYVKAESGWQRVTREKRERERADV